MVVLTCVSLMASGVGHLFTCLLPIRVSSLENPDPILNLCLEGLGLQEAVPRWREGHSIPDKHKCKNPQQNISKLNSAIY